MLTPILAHVHFRRGEVHHEMGEAKKAREHYGAALQIYRKVFPEHFGEESARLVAIQRALAELSRPEAGPGPAGRPGERPPRPRTAEREKEEGTGDSARGSEAGSEAGAGAGAGAGPVARTTGILQRLLGRGAASSRVLPGPPVWA
eukprot:tig00021275_g19879.t1